VIFYWGVGEGINSNIRRIENALVETNIPCHVPMLETREIDERVINGKITFSTFHACKGRQRKHVFGGVRPVVFLHVCPEHRFHEMPGTRCMLRRRGRLTGCI
jgi:hypothetical protein